MKVELIDLEEFFDDKYKPFKNGQGIGATGIVTPFQMVTRWNETKIDRDSEQEVNGLGYHIEEQIAITRDIYGFEDVLDPDYFDSDIVLADMEPDFKKMLKENMVIKYFNSSSGNMIMIFVPENNCCITSNQLEAIKLLGKQIEAVGSNLSESIHVCVGDLKAKKGVEADNAITPEMIAFLGSYVDDTYIPYMEDAKIIAEDELRVPELVH